MVLSLFPCIFIIALPNPLFGFSENPALAQMMLLFLYLILMSGHCAMENIRGNHE